MDVNPEYRLLANGVDVTNNLKANFQSLTLVDQAGMESDTLTLVFSDHGDPIQWPDNGGELDIALGYDGNLRNMGKFIVDEVESRFPNNTLTVYAKAVVHTVSTGGKRFLQTQKTRSFPEGFSLGGLVSTIAAEHELTPALDQDLASIVLPHIDQRNESDMHLLTRLSVDYDALIKPANGQLLLTKKGNSQSVSAIPLDVVTITPNQHTSGQAKWNARSPAGSVIATWQNINAGQEGKVTVGTGEPVTTLRHGFTDEATAKKAATARLNESTRSGGSLSLTIPGNNKVIAEAQVNLVGFRPRVAGRWLVTRATHTLNQGGYITKITAETTGQSAND